MEPQFIGVANAARVLGIGKTRMYEMLDHEVPSVRIGRRRLVSVEDLKDYCERLRASAGSVAS
jgi:excisionase family DNA binding protein